MVKLQLPFLVIHIVVLREVVLNTQYISLLLPPTLHQVHYYALTDAAVDDVTHVHTPDDDTHVTTVMADNGCFSIHFF